MFFKLAGLKFFRNLIPKAFTCLKLTIIWCFFLGCLYQYGIYPIGVGCQASFFKVQNYNMLFNSKSHIRFCAFRMSKNNSRKITLTKRGRNRYHFHINYFFLFPFTVCCWWGHRDPMHTGLVLRPREPHLQLSRPSSRWDLKDNIFLSTSHSCYFFQMSHFRRNNKLLSN